MTKGILLATAAFIAIGSAAQAGSYTTTTTYTNDGYVTHSNGVVTDSAPVRHVIVQPGFYAYDDTAIDAPDIVNPGWALDPIPGQATTVTTTDTPYGQKRTVTTTRSSASTVVRHADGSVDVHAGVPVVAPVDGYVRTERAVRDYSNSGYIDRQR